MDRHITALVEESVMATPSLSTETWAVRELLEPNRICRCDGYGGLPIGREFRLFGTRSTITHVQPYWPPDAVEKGSPNSDDWRERLTAASEFSRDESYALHLAASMAIDAVTAPGTGEEWSVDFMQTHSGLWYLIDMAPGEVSYRWGWGPGS